MEHYILFIRLIFLCTFVHITHQSTSITPTETMVGVTRSSVVSTPNPSESVTLLQPSLSATSTQVYISTATVRPPITEILYSKPVIVQGLKETTVREGQKLEMNCRATGNPKPFLIWQKENQLLKNTSRIMIRHDNSLVIWNTSRHDAGEYQCIAKNAVGLESASTALVNVNYISDVNITIDETDPVHEGTNVKLTCSAHSHPRVLFSWTRNGEEVEGYMIQVTVRNGHYVGVLHRRQISREMGGNYTCFAQNNDVGLSACASKSLHVHLANKPTYPPSEDMETTAHTIAIPIHNIKYLGNGKKVRYVQVIVQQLKDGTPPKRQPSSYNQEELGPYSGSSDASPYIAAVLSMKEYKSSFILGDDHVYSDRNQSTKERDGKVYRNVPLRPDRYYTAFQRMVSHDQDHESLDWIHPTKTGREDFKTSSTGSNLGLILGITFGLILLIGIVVFVVLRLFFAKKPKSPNNSTDALEMYPEREVFEPLERPARRRVEL